MTKWYNYPVISEKFKKGFDKFAFESEEQARDTLNRLFSQEEIKGALKYVRIFGSPKFIVFLPNAEDRCVVGKKEYMTGLKTGFIEDFVFNEKFDTNLM